MMLGLLLTVVLSVYGADDTRKTGHVRVLGPDVIDFGEYPAWQEKTARYRLRNDGNGRLEILKIRRTCGCASATSQKNVLAPGEETVIEVVIKPNAIFGAYSKNNFVETTDPDERFTRLTVAGKAIPLVEITPDPDFNMGRLPLGQAWSQQFDLEATIPDVTLGEPQVQCDYTLQASLTNLAAGAESRYRLNLGLSPAEKSGDLRCSIKIPVLSPTNHPPLALAVSGRVGVELATLPGILWLPLSDTPLTKRFHLRIIGQRTRQLNPKELVLPDREDASFNVNEDDRGLEITATFSPEFTRELYAQERLSLFFTVPNASSAKVVCRIKR